MRYVMNICTAVALWVGGSLTVLGQPCASTAVYSALWADGAVARGVTAAPGALLGDDLQLTAGGALESATFSVYNDPNSATTLESADVELVFYDLANGDEIGVISFPELGLDLEPGQYRLVHTGDVSALGIVLPQDVLAGVVISNNVGGERVGQVCVDAVDIGATGPTFYINDGVRDGFYTLADPNDPNVADPNAQLAFEIMLGDGLVDCNDNGVSDADDIAAGTSEDCDASGVPDECEFPQGLLMTIPSDDREIVLQRIGPGKLYVLQDADRGNYDPRGFQFLFETNRVGEVVLHVRTSEDYNGYLTVEVMTWGDGLGPTLVSELFYLSRSDEESVAFSAEVGRPYLIWFIPGDTSYPKSFTVELEGAIPDLQGDCTANGLYDACEPDCNGNGVADSCDIGEGASPDCDENGIPDDCDLAGGTALDCNANGVPDSCDVLDGNAADCNANGVPDACDTGDGASTDCNADGVPDECEPDCNSNGTADGCDIGLGASADVNGNGIPDECEPDCNNNEMPDDFDISTGVSADCNDNSVPDECDMLVGTSPDCNGNDSPDECDIATGGSLDCNANAVPDECDIAAGGAEEDCDENGRPDSCDISAGEAFDCDVNGVPDLCDVDAGRVADCNANGVPDACDTVPDWRVSNTIAAYEQYYSLEPFGFLVEFDADGEFSMDALFDHPVFGDGAYTITRDGRFKFGENATLHVAWAEYEPDQGEAYLAMVGYAPNRLLVAEWVDFDATSDSAGPVIFEAQIFETPINGAVAQYRYRHYGYPNAAPDLIGLSWRGALAGRWIPGWKLADGDVLTVMQGDPSPVDVDADGIPDECQRADVDCDGKADTYDIDAFVLALSDEAAYGAAYPGCPHSRADCNGDGVVDMYDIDAFVALLLVD